MVALASADNVLWIAGAVLVLAVLVIVGAVVVCRLRRTAVGPVALEGDRVSFSLQQLRQMRDEGVLSQEEYQRIREKLLGRAGAS